MQVTEYQAVEKTSVWPERYRRFTKAIAVSNSAVSRGFHAPAVVSLRSRASFAHDCLSRDHSQAMADRAVVDIVAHCEEQAGTTPHVLALSDAV